jgi:tetratricopeptide (TPR) repeat protein
MAILKDAEGQKVEAEKYFKSGVVYGAQSYPNSYFYYARFLNANGRREEAINQLYTALSMASAHMDCRYLLMDLLYADKRFEELKKVANSTLAIAPADLKAQEYMKLATSGKSQLDVTRETAETNKTPENYLNLSLQAYNASDYQGCIDAAKKALELKPDYAPAYNNIGSAYNILKQYKEAKESLLKAVELDPTSQLAKNNLVVAENGLKQQSK